MNPRVVQFYFPISGTLFIPIDTRGLSASGLADDMSVTKPDTDIPAITGIVAGTDEDT